MKLRCSILTGALILASVTIGEAAQDRFSVGVKGGTLGGGLELNLKLTDTTRVRLGANYLPYSFNATIGDFRYDYDTDFKNVSMILDWHPFDGAFFLSGGAYITDHTIDISGRLDDGRYAYLSDLVAIEGEADLGSSLAPYAGIGWRSGNGESGWGVSFDVGILFQDAPEVTELALVSLVDGSRYDGVGDYLDTQIREIENDLEALKYYPVASLMINYSF